MKRIKKFGVYQTAKVSGIIYFLIAAVFMIPFGIISSMFGGGNFPGFPFGGGFFFIFMPFLYGIIGFIMAAIGCLIYNAIAKWTGGIELEVETVDEA
ncbi:hypothetical protein [Reichenbachiella sp. MALMAid0571]|uniref:hypothetical protein n=1 Tax=Reichenbachiella sp. MALMAid0571 TaxID=3143939 RepID=UPI0032DFDEBF